MSSRRVRTDVCVASAVLLLMALLFAPPAVLAQAGPPFLTNDPGTPGDANWEINLGAMPVVTRAGGSHQVPQLDFNFGVGDRIQLTYEVPYVIDVPRGGTATAGWGNGNPGLKWRFLDEGEDGLQMSVFPQVELGVSRSAQARGIGGPGPRYLLPVEIARKVGPLDLDLEIGYYVPGNGPRERIIGFAAGRPVSDRLELDAELYDDRADGGEPHYTSIDIGGRYKLRKGLIALFMAGRSVSGSGSGQPEFMGYLGIQILLSDYGRRFTDER